MKFIALISVLIMSSINIAQAGAYTGEIEIILTAKKYDNKVYIKTKNNFNKPQKSCSKNKRYAFAFDGTTSIGKNFLLLLTSALTTNTEVILEGENICNESSSGTVETLTSLKLKAK